MSKEFEKNDNNIFAILKDNKKDEFTIINKDMLESQVKIKVTNDNRKAVRAPKILYERLTANNKGAIKYHLISKVLRIFKVAYKERGIEVFKNFSELETIPIKVSNDDFKILKILKFQTDETYINIIASAISYYLYGESGCNDESQKNK
ncbi:hypothetical protein ACWO4B_003222 [Clostridium sporogenes]